MHRSPPIAVVLLAVATAILLVIIIVATAKATPEIGEHDNGWSITDETYLRTYEKCWKAFGTDCGANLVDDNRADPLPPGKIRASTARMDGWLNPETEAIAASGTSYDVYAEEPVESSGGMGCTGMEAESGSLGYANNTNPDYVGCYQISTQHYDSGGICEGMGTDPASQDACAANLCEEQGSGAWTNAAGSNPC